MLTKRLLFIVFFMVSLLISCTQDPSSDLTDSQPCQAPDDGSREGYHSATDNVWLPECNNSLQREYWRVFLQSDTSAYIIPRPDGRPELQPVCDDVNHDLHELITTYQLCTAASNSAQVETVNNILPVDALQITHYLHSQLFFELAPDGEQLTPFPIPSDIIDACQLDPTTNLPELDEICAREQERLDSGNSIGFSYSGPGAVQLAERLNMLYGISSN